VSSNASDDSAVLRERLASLEREYRNELAAREKRQACDEALSALRQQVWSMRRGDDLVAVTDAIGTCLTEAGIGRHAHGINFVHEDDAPQGLTQILRTTEGAAETLVKDLKPGSAMERCWQDRRVVYRRDLLESDPYGEFDIWARDAPPAPRRSVVDIPFSHGTFAVNSLEPDAFSNLDIAFFERVAGVLSEAMQRWADLGLLERRNAELAEQLREGQRREEELAQTNHRLEERERLLSAFHETGKALLAALDPDTILDTLSMQVIEAGVFRSIMIAVVDAEASKVCVVRAYNRVRGDDGSWEPVQKADLAVGFECDLDDEIITATVARTGVMEVVEGWDDRYDERLRETTSPQAVAYFVPIMHKGRPIAVLGTGSSRAERGEVLRRIDVLRPFFDQVAIALYHARLYADLQERERQLRQMQKMEVMGELTAGIAHNFNNLLQGVTGNLELAIEEATADVRDRITDALRIVNTQAELVRQLMAYTRRGTGAAQEPVDIGAIVESVVGMCRNTFDRRIELLCDIDGGCPSVLGDAAQLEQVVLNLCLNARDAVTEDESSEPRISIRVGLQIDSGARNVRLSIADNGAGMDRAICERVFDPFFTTKEVGSGTGLGLSIVHGIVRQHQGSVTCDSRVGAGSTFHVVLPASDSDASESPSADEPAPEKGDETILLVEDEEAVRSTVAFVLRRLGYRVLVAADGEEGLAVLERSRESVDLILLDVSMPRMTGPEMLQRLDPGDCAPVILFTGYAMPHELQDRVAAVLEKPLGPRVLLRCVRSVLDGADRTAEDGR